MGDSVRVEGGRSLSELRDVSSLHCASIYHTISEHLTQHLRKAKLLQEDTNGMADPNEVVLTLIEQFSKEDTYIKELFNTEVCDISHCRSGGCYTKKVCCSSQPCPQPLAESR